MKRTGLVAVAMILAACSNDSPGDGGTGPESGGASFVRYVAIGTSVSMGVASDGVVGSSQKSSWPALLAADVGANFSLPLISAPGCLPPIAAPLSGLRRTDGSLITAASVCSGNEPGITLPAQNVAVAGATTSDAVGVTGASGGIAARVLSANQTQLTAMRAQNPTFVSVELGSNEVLPGVSGLTNETTITPFATFAAAYQTVIDNVKATGAKAVLVSTVSDVTKFPAVRTSAEIASQRSAFALLNVSVNPDCNTSPNLITTLKIVTAVTTAALMLGLGPYNLSCADIPGTTDYVVTPADVASVNALLAQMNAFIKAKADENGYATFSLDVLYKTSKDNVPFSVATMLISSTPFGPNISLDSVHPSAAGQAILAASAKAAILARYGSTTK